MVWIKKKSYGNRGALTLEAALVLPLMLLIGLGLAQYLDHLRVVEVTRQAFHNTVLQLTLQETQRLDSPAGTSLAMGANLAFSGAKPELQYLYVREASGGDFVAKLYWVRKVPLLGYVVTSFEKTGRSIYRANDLSWEAERTNEIKVYVTRTGSKYHLQDCFHLRRSQFEMDQSAAEAQGYEACAHCILGVPLFERKPTENTADGH